MNAEKQNQINENCKLAAEEADKAVTELCKAASTAILDRQFCYAANIIEKAKAADAVRAGCYALTLQSKA
jgi:hypothetical protein